jgi:4-hydroxybenzoate polyprenyltransferase
VIAYLLGAFLVGWGLWCFGYELLYPAQTVRESVEANKALFIYTPNMFCGVIVCWGVILILTTYRHYRGGIWTYLGAVLIGLSMIFAALAVDGHFTGGAPVMVYVLILMAVAFVFLLGCGSLFAGQIRHRRKCGESPPNTALEPTATAP